jgi:5'-nucleotidase
MTLILTNDDGIDAPGIKALQQAIDGRGILVAPTGQLSGCGHQVTTHQPLRLHRRSEIEYAVDGTPADCTRLALKYLVSEAQWVLSGINAGGNLGVDVYTSGTVAAVREATMLGIRGIAISHRIKRPLVIDWDWASYWTTKILQELFSHPLPQNCFWNVNLPHLEPDSPDPKIIFCEPSTQPLPVEFRVEGNLFYYKGEYGQRERQKGTDVDVCFSGNISVTQIRL